MVALIARNIAAIRYATIWQQHNSCSKSGCYTSKQELAIREPAGFSICLTIASGPLESSSMVVVGVVVVVVGRGKGGGFAEGLGSESIEFSTVEIDDHKLVKDFNEKED